MLGSRAGARAPDRDPEAPVARGRSGVRSRDSRASEASRRSRSRTPSGPLTTTSASATSRLSSVEAEQTSSVGMPSPGELADRLERLEVAEVVAGEEERARLELLDERADDQALVHAVRADLDDVPAGLDHQVVRSARAAERRQQPLERRLGVLEAAGVHGDGQPLVLDEGLAGVGRAQRARSSRGTSPGRAGAAARSPGAGWRSSARCRTGRRGRAPCPRPRSRCRPRPDRRGPAPAGPGGR